MANRRMIQKDYSYNKNFNLVTEFAQLLHHRITVHTDDFGRIEGDPIVLKAIVMPLSSRTEEDIESALQELENIEEIIRYELSEQKVIIFPKFESEQTGLNRRTKSKYPNPPKHITDKFPEILGSSYTREPNKKNKLNEEEFENKGNENSIAPSIVKTTFSKEATHQDPRTYNIQSPEEQLALDIWEEFEPDNFWAFYSTYLKAAQKGIPYSTIDDWRREMRDSKGTQRPGAIFNRKMTTFLSHNLFKK